MESPEQSRVVPLPIVRQGTSDQTAGLVAELEALAPGQVRFDGHHRLLYATDASNYQVQPLGVVLVRDIATLHSVVSWCGQRKLPVLLRGGGTSLAGQCANKAVVLDHSTGCRRILSVNKVGCLAHVEPGLGVDELNRHLVAEGTGLFFAPDPATSAQASIGGCIGNNAAGARSIKYGRTCDNVVGLDIGLVNGTRFWIGPSAGRRDANALNLAAGVEKIVREYAALIRDRFPKTMRRNAGYALDSILAQLDRGVTAENLDLTGLICGSEGTLAAVLGAHLKLRPLPLARGLAIASFASVEAAIAAVPAILGTGPSAVELLDDVVLEAARGNNECRRYMDLITPLGDKPPRAVLYVEYQVSEAGSKIAGSFRQLAEVLGGAPMGLYLDQAAQLRAWALRKAGEPLLHNMSAHRKPVTVIEDNAIPIENLSRFVDGCKAIIARHGTMAAYYAHASVGVLHIRPMLDLHVEADRDRMRAIAVEVADLARECGGVMSGEHGDGRSRGPLLERYYGAELMEAFRRIKRLFDPDGLLNPGMIVDAGPVENITSNLRVRPGDSDLSWPQVDTFFDYSAQEGFAGAVEMCNGAGVCRKTALGTMCPSYRATLDERHSTRGRGNALRTAISGQISAAGHNGHGPWSDPDTIETLSLCLSCKACKSECPSNVDVAKLKAEYTAQRYRQEGRVPLAARAFGNIRLLNRLGSLAPGLANWLTARRTVRAVLNRQLGLADRRSMPRFERSLFAWFRGRKAAPATTGPKVVLFADCFTTYNEPAVGRAAITLLQTLGYQAILPRAGCCGRSMISTGNLAEAQRTIDRTLSRLQPHIDDPQVKAIVVAEPSCLAAMKDEWLSLKLQTPLELRQRCADKAMMLEDFVNKGWEQHPLRPAVPDQSAVGPQVLMHGHCHQKAIMGEESSAGLMRRLLGDRLKVLPSGCCGMAGSFGFLEKNLALSQQIFAQSLSGHLKNLAPDTIVLAPGTSCRHQMRDEAKIGALHPIELAAKIMCRDATGATS